MSTNQQTVSRRSFTAFRSARIGPLIFVLFTVLAPHRAMAVFVPCGDANANGVVTTSDAFAALRGAIGLSSPCIHNCDCDADGDRSLTTGDALQILHSAVVTHDSLGCAFYDGCFYDTDCDDGYECGTDPEWSCDAACVPE